jgi:hypothetical protein
MFILKGRTGLVAWPAFLLILAVGSYLIYCQIIINF